MGVAGRGRSSSATHARTTEQGPQESIGASPKRSPSADT
jgi:hypothetical protein